MVPSEILVKKYIYIFPTVKSARVLLVLGVTYTLEVI